MTIVFVTIGLLTRASKQSVELLVGAGVTAAQRAGTEPSIVTTLTSTVSNVAAPQDNILELQTDPFEYPPSAMTQATQTLVDGEYAASTSSLYTDVGPTETASQVFDAFDKDSTTSWRATGFNANTGQAESDVLTQVDGVQRLGDGSSLCCQRRGQSLAYGCARGKILAI
jgi:hypothetical protein